MKQTKSQQNLAFRLPSLSFLHRQLDYLMYIVYYPAAKLVRRYPD